MFIYEGKLEWGNYAKNETAVIVLPAGPIRAGDVVWLMSQWTVDSKGNKKVNLTQRIPVHQVTKTEKGDDTFTSKPGYYSWEMASNEGYEKLKVIMSKNDGAVKSEMEFKRIWMPQGDSSTESGRIWMGVLNWDGSSKATDEFGVFIVPEGFGQGKPVISVFQWTHDRNNNEKVISWRAAPQKMISDDENGVKFSYHTWFDITCTWDKKTDNLTVHMKEGSTCEQDLGGFKLLTLLNPHSHDWDPPLPPPQDAQLQVHLPQPEPSLPRVLEPLPFPNGLIETLRHTIAYADQAGYLAKYAHERFNQLDADYHVRGEEINAANASIAQLKKETKQLGDDLTVEKAKTADLTTRLAEAQATYQAELKKRDDEIKNDKGHDAEDHKTIDRLVSQLEYERASKAEVQKNLDETKTALTEAEARLAADGATIAALTTRIATLEAQLEVQKKDVEKLQKEIQEKTDRISQLGKNNADLQTLLERSRKDVNTKQTLIDQKDATIRDQTTQIDELAKESESKTIEIGKLQSQIYELQQQTRNKPAETQFLFKAKMRSQITDRQDIMVDLNAGGGRDPAVHGWEVLREEPNQLWDFYSVPGIKDAVVIKNSRTNFVMRSTGHWKRVLCDSHDAADQAAQWVLEGMSLDSIQDNTVVKIRNLKDGTYLDLERGGLSNGTPFITHNGNTGPTQHFKILML